jgi:phosphoribosylamine--glycine ligase
MRILLLGSGGREHALAWKLKQNTTCDALFIAPGNGGTALLGTNLPFAVTDFDSLKSACLREKISMVIVGPEDPLVLGVVDFIRNDPALKDILVIGPSKEAAQLEGSKSFAKAFMNRHGIPTAEYKEFTIENFEEGVEYLQKLSPPIVLKADGLAAGKGVIICQHHVEAVAEFELMIHQAKFGEAGKKVVVESFLDGIELSVFVLTDGKNYRVLPEAKDYKRVGEADSGLNTGGMGAVSPVPFANESFMKKVEEQVILPTIHGLEKDKLSYQGFIFIGLMKVGDDPFVIEYNCRLGDPETEVILPRLKNDLVELMQATAGKKLDQVVLQVDTRSAVGIMAVSGGYPGNIEKGFKISGLQGNYGKQSMIFQAGTVLEGEDILTNGGRVLCVTSLAENIEEAAANSLDILAVVDFEGKYFRKDIGWEFRPS